MSEKNPLVARYEELARLEKTSPGDRVRTLGALSIDPGPTGEGNWNGSSSHARNAQPIPRYTDAREGPIAG